MANIYTAIGVSTTTFISDIATALSSKYGANVTLHYQSTTDLIFSCSAMSSKYIKITYASDQDHYVYYGDAWTSGTTITNQVQFEGCYNTNIANTFTEAHLVLGDSFMLMNLLNSDADNRSMMWIIGKTNVGESIVAGFSSSSHTTYVLPNTRVFNISQGKALKIITFEGTFYGLGSAVCKIPIFFVEGSGCAPLLDGSGNLATIDGLFISSYATSSSTVMKGSNYLITSCELYSATASAMLKTGLMAEW